MSEGLLTTLPANNKLLHIFVVELTLIASHFPLIRNGNGYHRDVTFNFYVRATAIRLEWYVENGKLVSARIGGTAVKYSEGRIFL